MKSFRCHLYSNNNFFWSSEWSQLLNKKLLIFISDCLQSREISFSSSGRNAVISHSHHVVNFSFYLRFGAYVWITHFFLWCFYFTMPRRRMEWAHFKQSQNNSLKSLRQFLPHHFIFRVLSIKRFVCRLAVIKICWRIFTFFGGDKNARENAIQIAL